MEIHFQEKKPLGNEFPSYEYQKNSTRHYYLERLLSVLFAANCTHSKKDLQVLAGNKTLPEKVDFNFHIKPLLADRCFACHGPDAIFYT